MPNQSKTPARAVRIDDALWDAVKAEAARRGETATDVVRRALREHLSGSLNMYAVMADDDRIDPPPVSQRLLDTP